ncbi:DUF3375 domain-containing protein [Massilia horti]|uniref:DUF3375 domain-containing protein n=2 Tax=Massilia horti TaxID=2562153 RepID=A0A4Y9T3L3_9BURK|nr:DUF3375 domain-containing protein [Massilia horti]
MDYQQLLEHRQSHPAWRLLLADNGPMIASFLHQVFVLPNTRGMPRQQLASLLDDHLFRLHDAAGETRYPKAASAYLDDWASNPRGWLRKYYLDGDDEPHYDLTPEAELALGWMRQLGDTAPVGVASAAREVFRLLQEIVDGTELSPRTRVAALRKRKAQIDAEIARIEQGQLDMMEPGQVRERFLRAARTGDEMLSAFRALDRRFRAADRAFREQITTGEEGVDKDAHRDLFAGLDEAQSLQALVDLLTSPGSTEELGTLLEKVTALEPVRTLGPDERLRRMPFDWLDAAKDSQARLARLSAQLRRHLDDRARLENRRIIQLIRGIEQNALALRGRIPDPDFIHIDETSPAVALPMDRTLYNPPFKPRITGQAKMQPAMPVPADALFAQRHIDELRLITNIRNALRTRSQVSLATVAQEYPIEHGLAELAAYFKLATDELRCAIDEERTEVVRWTDSAGRQRAATLPLVIYTL